jgi:hypothetical protein
MHVQPPLEFETRATLPSGGQALARIAIGWLMLPIWEYLNNTLHDFIAVNDHYTMKFLRMTALKRIMWAECVWWGEPIRIQKRDARPEEAVGGRS